MVNMVYNKIKIYYVYVYTFMFKYSFLKITAHWKDVQLLIIFKYSKLYLSAQRHVFWNLLYICRN